MTDNEEEGRKEMCPEGKPVTDTEEEGRKEMCPDAEKEGSKSTIRYREGEGRVRVQIPRWKKVGMRLSIGEEGSKKARVHQML